MYVVGGGTDGGDAATIGLVGGAMSLKIERGGEEKEREREGGGKRKRELITQLTIVHVHH